MRVVCETDPRIAREIYLCLNFYFPENRRIREKLGFSKFRSITDSANSLLTWNIDHNSGLVAPNAR